MLSKINKIGSSVNVIAISENVTDPHTHSLADIGVTSVVELVSLLKECFI